MTLQIPYIPMAPLPVISCYTHQCVLILWNTWVDTEEVCGPVSALPLPHKSYGPSDGKVKLWYATLVYILCNVPWHSVLKPSSLLKPHVPVTDWEKAAPFSIWNDWHDICHLSERFSGDCLFWVGLFKVMLVVMTAAGVPVQSDVLYDVNVMQCWHDF